MNKYLRRSLFFIFVWVHVEALYVSHILAEEGKSGVAANRLKLPKGPGSLEGLGEDANPQLNMGIVTYRIPIQTPKGYSDLSPNLALSYSSSNGNSEMGIGWTMTTSSISRMTSRGLPKYFQSDSFVAKGGEELVQIRNASTYRTRFESSFVRYQWLESENGQRGYWIAEYPDGKRASFGATLEGQFVDEARVEGRGGTFEYCLVEMADVHNHRIRYSYEKDEGRPYLTHIAWVQTAEGPRYEVELGYSRDQRQDILSDGKPGVEIKLAWRLENIGVRVRGELLRRYTMFYEPYDESGGLTRLRFVETLGADDREPFPVSFSFAYTGSFDPFCIENADCELPYLSDLGSVGVDFRDELADFIDLNGDALPDVVHTAEENHIFHLQHMDEDSQEFEEPHQSQTDNAQAIQLSSDRVHMVDINGDGYSDMVDGQLQRTLFNHGDGDWSVENNPALNLPDFESDRNLRFLDVDYDRKIDVIHVDPAGVWFFKNEGGRFNPNAQMTDLEVEMSFVQNNLQLSDMNGDGLMDLVELTGEDIIYRMNLGHGHFAEPKIFAGVTEGFEPSELQLMDLNGDSLSDVVILLANTVQFSLNKNGTSFGDWTTLENIEEGSIPERDENISVRFADMNGSGSTDIVWIDSSGLVKYLELFPRRPNLLSLIENGVGKVIEFTYGNTAEHMARDGGPATWRHRLPHAMITIDLIETFDTLSGVRQTQDFHYHHGFYDGIEKQFRGFEEVEAFTYGDESIEEGRTVYHYDVGAVDPYFKANVLRKEVFSAGTILTTEDHEYEQCPIAEVEGAIPFQSRFICQTKHETVIKEGQSQEKWVIVQQRKQYDSYGNIVHNHQLGVVQKGLSDCDSCADNRDENVQGEPCGLQCSGDEILVETEFVSPTQTDGKWILGAVSAKRMKGKQGSDVFSEDLFYYDGENFEGMERGMLTYGILKKHTTKKNLNNEIVLTERLAHDLHGNVIQTVDANGHSRRFGYDEDGLLLRYEEIVMDNPEQTSYSLRQTVDLHSLFEMPISSTDWVRYEADEPQSEPNITAYEYDLFGRIIKIAKPGDSLASPTQIFRYDFGDPVSRIVIDIRSEQEGPFDLRTVICFDGRGRKIQERKKIAQNLFQISGFNQFNRSGKESRVYQPYTSASDRCNRTPSAETLFTTKHYDAIGRTKSQFFPDEWIYDSPSEIRYSYTPLATQVFDSEDLDPESPHFGTPTTTLVDGLGRTVSVEQLLHSEQEPIRTQVTYDHLGRIRSLIDNHGNEKKQFYDLIGRVIRVEDPDAGTTTRRYDNVGNLVEIIDTRGTQIHLEYDEANRLVAQWNAANPQENRIEWSYDVHPSCGENNCANLEGLLAEVRYPLIEEQHGVDHFTYDRRTNQKFFSRTRFGRTWMFESIFDNADRLIEKRYPGGFSTQFVIDFAGRTTAIPSFVQQATFTNQGQVNRIHFSHGLVTDFHYDDRMRLSELSTIRNAREQLQAYFYTYDRAAHLISLVDGTPNVLADESLFSVNANYTYDALYRVVQAEFDPGRNQNEILSYQYDSINNIISKISSNNARSPAHVGVLQYDQRGNAGPHAVSQAGNQALTYDANGNLVTFDGFEHIWDWRDRLSESQKNGETVARFSYDNEGERTIKIEETHRIDYLEDDFEIRDGIVSFYIRLLNQRIAKVESDRFAATLLFDIAPAIQINEETIQSTPDQKISVADAWLLHTQREEMFEIESERLANEPVRENSVEQILHASLKILLLDENGELKTFLHTNHLGSTTLSTDNQGEVLQRFEHYPFGQIRHQSHHLPEYSYTGQERDLSTGLSYHSARYFHPKLGRWTRPDPLFTVLDNNALRNIQESQTAYAYVSNNPIVTTDPSGFRAARGPRRMFRHMNALNLRSNWTNYARQVRRTHHQYIEALPKTPRDSMGMTKHDIREEFVDSATKNLLQSSLYDHRKVLISAVDRLSRTVPAGKTMFVTMYYDASKKQVSFHSPRTTFWVDTLKAKNKVVLYDVIRVKGTYDSKFAKINFQMVTGQSSESQTFEPPTFEEQELGGKIDEAVIVDTDKADQVAKENHWN